MIIVVDAVKTVSKSLKRDQGNQKSEEESRSSRSQNYENQLWILRRVLET